jgi:hypothetical protein
MYSLYLRYPKSKQTQKKEKSITFTFTFISFHSTTFHSFPETDEKRGQKTERERRTEHTTVGMYVFAE